MTTGDELIRVAADSAPGRSVLLVIDLVWGIGVTSEHGNPSRQSEAADPARHVVGNHRVERVRPMGANAVAGFGVDGFRTSRGSPVDRGHAIYGTAVVLE